MHYRITQINIDFEADDFELSPTEQQDVIDDVMVITGKHLTLKILWMKLCLRQGLV